MADLQQNDKNSGSLKQWIVPVLTLIGAVVVVRMLFGLLWAFLPLVVLLGVLYAGYRMLSGSDDSSSGRLDTSAARTPQIRQAPNSRARSDFNSDSALRKLRERSGASSPRNADQAAMDDFDRRMRELDALDLDLDDEINRS